MRLITVTSDNYLPSTLTMLESVRVWHPALPVTVYALEKGWIAEHEARLRELDAEVEVIAEHDPRQRSGPVGTTLFAVWKIEVFLRQTGLILFLDSDILVLRPLDEVFRRVERDGWLSVEEHRKRRGFGVGPGVWGAVVRNHAVIRFRVEDAIVRGNEAVTATWPTCAGRCRRSRPRAWPGDA